MNPNAPIGVFDSGLGGLTVLRALKQHLPNESIIYFGDTARVPYGIKSAKTVTHFSQQITNFLMNQGVKIIVVACNTASALALPNLKKNNSIPILGVIEPGVVAAIQQTHNNRIGVIGTTATISSHAYSSRLKKLRPYVTVIDIACPLFVPLVEEGWVHEPVTYQIAKKYLEPLSHYNVDTVILGCTHYPILKKTIQRVLPTNVKLIDSAEAVAQKTVEILKEYKASAQSGQSIHKFYVTDFPQKFKELGKRFFGETLPDVTLIHID